MEAHFENPSAIQKQRMSNFRPRPDSTESYGTIRSRFLKQNVLKGEQGKTPEEQSVTLSLKSGKQVKKKKTKGKQQISQSFNPLEEEENEKKRLQEMQEKHMRVLDDLTKLRNHYYLEYLSALTEKVEKQRKEIKKRTERMERKLKQKEVEQKETQLARRKYDRAVDLPSEHDTFIKDLFKSHWYNVIKLEEQMQKEGKLRTIQDYENFWEDIMQPEKYREMFVEDENNKHLQDDGSSHNFSKGSLHFGSRTSSLTSVNTIDHQPQIARELSLIREDTENPKSRSAKRKPSYWAVTQLQKLKSSASFLSVPIKGRRQEVHPLALELDQKYPKTELPHLHMLDMNLEPPKEDPEIVRMREEFNARAQVRNHKRKAVMNMHEMSITHQAATSRILLDHPDFMARLEGPDIGDVTGAVKDMEVPVESQTPFLPTVVPAVVFQNRRKTTQFLNEVIDERPESEERDAMQTQTMPSSRGSSSRSSISSRESYHVTETDREKSISKESRRQEIESPLPLTLESIRRKCEIKEAKCLSTLWTNYARELPAIT
ncbi:uncharacterized protein LOC117113620 isoform X2 [Anneissia japonica]|uniref:uncharacterized protein LOC117113620 isoform X2 n=1 Tax=Anneissia japonica TaxID=1529436 RepID=UPI001425691E|nr:uncharacterized protein LOC117113620 isoform X2 [Anneissia japonica]